MASSGTFVVVGAGLAGGKAVEALRDKGFGGRIVLLGAEEHLPYERPPLSKGYLAGKTERDEFTVHPREWYAEHDVELRLGARVTAIDVAAREVHVAGAEPLAYDELLLATGATPRRLPVPGADAEGVHTLRTVEQSEELQALLGSVSRLVVVGAGWIGLEVAAAAREADVAVTVVESAELPLLGALGPEAAQVFADLHREHGVDLRLGATVEEIVTEGGRATGVRLGDGTVLEADAVLVAIGAAPDTALAEAAGLDVEDGVLVDAGLRTSDPHVYAAGDVARATHPRYGTGIRVEHWANALNQPAVAAASMLGEDAAYDRLPYFYSDQYDLGMEYTGFAAPGGYDEVVFRGDRAGREFIAFWLSGGRVLAGMNVNVWDVTDPIKALITSGTPVDRARLADPSVPLEDLAG